MYPLPSFLILLFSTVLSSSRVSSDKCNKDDKKVLSALKEELFLIGWPLDQVPCCDLKGIECDIQTGRVIGIDISQLSINFTIPPIIADIPFLRNIRFHKNPGLTGPIPSFLANIKTLAFIDFSWNSFTYPIPEFFAQLTLFSALDLSFNQLTGTIPPSLGLLPAINGFEFSRNHLTGSIPETFGATKMYYLALSHNNLTGAIPQSFASNQFSTLDLSRNQLSGDATHVFGKQGTLGFELVEEPARVQHV